MRAQEQRVRTLLKLINALVVPQLGTEAVRHAGMSDMPAAPRMCGCLVDYFPYAYVPSHAKFGHPSGDTTSVAWNDVNFPVPPANVHNP